MEVIRVRLEDFTLQGPWDVRDIPETQTPLYPPTPLLMSVPLSNLKLPPKLVDQDSYFVLPFIYLPWL